MQTAMQMQEIDLKGYLRNSIGDEPTDRQSQYTGSDNIKAREVDDDLDEEEDIDEDDELDEDDDEEDDEEIEDAEAA